jgi:nuclear mRNA export protein SAC3
MKLKGLCLLLLEIFPSVQTMMYRKYRVLDDCSRLRGIVSTLPARRHFVPSLLTISWINTEGSETTSDLHNMISKLVEDGVLGSHHDFAIANETKALDDKLEEALASLALDVEGKLAQSMSVQGTWTL